ncbi:unnamed protein product [Cuscuta campestris]|uniref:Uncharacterized protein n=1 Tax=Cuscuta campestris TaxID=132261 RepID=A0A484KHI7_9ASTE|nr:unnamed protein product [Cuscuta campestris]
MDFGVLPMGFQVSSASIEDALRGQTCIHVLIDHCLCRFFLLDEDFDPSCTININEPSRGNGRAEIEFRA